MLVEARMSPFHPIRRFPEKRKNDVWIGRENSQGGEEAKNFHPQVAGVNGHGDRQPIRWKIWSESGILRAFHSTRLGHSPYSCFSSLHFIFRQEGVRFTSIHVYIYTHTRERVHFSLRGSTLKNPLQTSEPTTTYIPLIDQVSFPFPLHFFSTFFLSFSLSLFPWKGNEIERVCTEL